MSGEVYAAAKASTCCDAAGEESPKGRRGSNTPMSGDYTPFSPLSTPYPPLGKSSGTVVKKYDRSSGEAGEGRRTARGVAQRQGKDRRQ